MILSRCGIPLFVDLRQSAFFCTKNYTSTCLQSRASPLLGVSETIHIKHVFKMFNIPNFLPVQISYIKFESVSASQNGPEHLDSRSNRLILWPISNKSFVQVLTTFPQMAGFYVSMNGILIFKKLDSFKFVVAALSPSRSFSLCRLVPQSCLKSPKFPQWLISSNLVRWFSYRRTYLVPEFLS